MSRSKQKGTAFESLIRDYLVEHWDDRIVRVAQAGSKDVGDLANFRIGPHKVAVECKNVKRMDLAGWIAEAHEEARNIQAVAGVVVHKRARKGAAGDQYVTMTLRDFLSIAGLSPDAGRLPSHG